MTDGYIIAIVIWLLWLFCSLIVWGFLVADFQSIWAELSDRGQSILPPEWYSERAKESLQEDRKVAVIISLMGPVALIAVIISVLLDTKKIKLFKNLQW